MAWLPCPSTAPKAKWPVARPCIRSGTATLTMADDITDAMLQIITFIGTRQR